MGFESTCLLHNALQNGVHPSGLHCVTLPRYLENKYNTCLNIQMAWNNQENVWVYNIKNLYRTYIPSDWNRITFYVIYKGGTKWCCIYMSGQELKTHVELVWESWSNGLVSCIWVMHFEFIRITTCSYIFISLILLTAP